MALAGSLAAASSPTETYSVLAEVAGVLRVAQLADAALLVLAHGFLRHAEHGADLAEGLEAVVVQAVAHVKCKMWRSRCSSVSSMSSRSF